METDVSVFWKRLDEILKSKEKDYKYVAEYIGVPYPTLIGWRYRGRYPKTEEVILIAECLTLSLDYLLTGKEAEPFCDEALLVDHDEKLRLIVRQLKADPTFLEAISITLASKERTDAEKVVN